MRIISMIAGEIVVTTGSPIEAEVDARIDLACRQPHRIGTVRDRIAVAVFCFVRSLVLQSGAVSLRWAVIGNIVL